MPHLKRLVLVAAVALFALLGATPSAVAASQPAPPAPPDGTGVAPPSEAPGDGDLSGGLGTDGEAKPPLLSPAPKPQRSEDPPPDEGLPVWLWAMFALLAGGVAALAMFLLRGSRAPANSVPVMESTAELLAVGRGHPPMTGRRPGNDR